MKTTSAATTTPITTPVLRFDEDVGLDKSGSGGSKNRSLLGVIYFAVLYQFVRNEENSLSL
jgi:hypothetical protein